MVVGIEQTTDGGLKEESWRLGGQAGVLISEYF